MTDHERAATGDGSASIPHWTEIERAFAHALDLPLPLRSAFAADCSTDPAVCSAVAQLLEQHESLEATDAGFLAPIDRARAARLVREAEEDPARIGRYTIRGVLGRGAFATVHLAHDPELDREVAIKRLAGHLGDDGEWIARFVAEARAASQLAHPHIVTVHDIGRADDGRLFIVMGYDGSSTLRDLLARGLLDLRSAVQRAIEVADGLAAAHAAGLVHRDIKPENLLVTPRGVRITDFGIAKADAGPAMPPGAVLGTAAYMSPEQSLGQDVDARSDLWSLGVVLFELLTGTRPFAGATTAETLEAVRTADVPTPSRLRSEIPARLDAIVQRCLTRPPSSRFPSAESLRDALQAAARTLPPAAEQAARDAPPAFSAPSGHEAQHLPDIRLRAAVRHVDRPVGTDHDPRGL